MKKIGITGGIGSGKTYVCNLINKLYNIPIYNTDDSVKIIMLLESTKVKIKSTFGDDSYIDGEINKKKFNRLLYNNNDNLLLMNSIITPLIEIDFNEWCDKQTSPYIIMESAVLFENKLDTLFDVIICVVSNRELRIRRLLERDKTTIDLILNKMSVQFSDEEKEKKSDFILFNNEEGNQNGVVKRLHNKLINFNKK